jgi:hypothetical protein
MKSSYVLKNVTPESDDYYVEQIHFHWGPVNNNVQGSEHLREGRSYPLEVCFLLVISQWIFNQTYLDACCDIFEFVR